MNLSNVPEPIAKIYRQAYASFDSVDDPRVKRALIAVMRAVENEATVIGSPDSSCIELLSSE